MSRLPDPTLPLQKKWYGSVAERFRMHVSDDVAIISELDSWTYRELDLASSSLARLLLGNRREGRNIIAIYARRSPMLAVCLLSIIRAGFAFVILDPRYPFRRIRQCLELAQPTGLINLTERRIPEDVSQVLWSLGTALIIEAPESKESLISSAFNESESDRVELSKVDDPDCLLYMAFTSGTTGSQKAILGSHGPVSHFIDWQQKQFGITRKDRVSCLSGLGHDPLLRDILMPLWVGASICIPEQDCFEIPNRLYEWMYENEVTIAHLTPSITQLMLAGIEKRKSKQLGFLRYAFLGGEVLRYSVVERLRSCAPYVSIVNCYGTTETPQVVGYHIVNPHSSDVPSDSNEHGASVPIGKGIDNSQLILMNNRGELCDVGERGEICVRTCYQALGIHSLAGDVMNAYFANPYRDDSRDMLYRTGDFGYYLGNGEVVYKGRDDRQIKIRGYRVEVDELESVLAANHEILEYYVDIEGENGRDRSLSLYAVLREGCGKKGSDIRMDLSAQLPSYVVPEKVVILSEMPRTPNGKIDLRELRIDEERSSENDMLQSSSGGMGTTEAVLLGVFRKVLYSRSISIDDRLSAVGINSLQAIELCFEIERARGRVLSVGEITGNRSIRGLSVYLDDLDQRRSDDVSAEMSVGSASGRSDSIGGVQPERNEQKLHLIPRNENLVVAVRNRVWQLLARIAPDVWRVKLHRMRGVRIGKNVSIGYDSIIETSYPWLVSIGDNVNIGMRATIIAHFRGMVKVGKGAFTVEIHDDAFVGPGVIILPGTIIGKGAVVGAGSVVNDSVPPLTFVQGNPAKPIARCGVALSRDTKYAEFIRKMIPL